MGSMRGTNRMVVCSKELVEKFAPDFKGIYILYNFHGKVIYIGRDDQSIKKSLLEFISGSSGPNTNEAYYFTAAFDSNPSQRASHLLYLFNRYSGKVPAFNESSVLAG